ncbi:multidrug effflux MFS transporter [Legionella oakridgensis]|uniref:Bcr/CflA family efflux transporter n=2 Tax=Legionella oakridgensis TaxID=29423 RepID=W0BHD0_9GAMM|nr:multidrug effflux MFS transporter [Legionella oakridgensis]AHE68136.1 drug resistance transporter, Bcr/CflA subfamily [Legionella oakridgensis ATCC 33761 = DSM 21215]ETO92350.1 drug resistance transporter, Bcr/CflA subfamily [Legionella oakridgensis RV-2-2007]KTD37265.1 multidrug resistance protein D [Legionella oakridgensis]STY21105.1 multidrug resistance protein D [Legionella longbeachae]
MKAQNNLSISVMVIAAIALGNAGSTLYLPAMPNITESLHTTGAMMKLSLSLFLIGFSLSQLLYGPLSDAFGRKINLLFGLGIFSIGSIISALATDISPLLAGRLIEGLGIGAANAVGYALMRDIYSGSKLTAQLSYISVFVGSMPLIAPVIGGYLVEYINWQSCFYVLTIVALLLLALKIMFLPETLALRDPTARRPNVIFKKYWTLLTSSNYMGFTLIAGFGFAAIFTTGSTLPFLLVNKLGISPSLYGWIAGIPALGYLSGSFVSGYLAKDIALSKLILFGSLFGILSMIVGLLVNVNAVHFTLYTLIAPLIFFMFGIGFLVPTGSSGAMAPFPQIAGAESALLGAFMFCIASILTAIGSHLNITNPVPLFLLLTCVCVITFILFFVVKKDEKDD